MSNESGLEYLTRCAKAAYVAYMFTMFDDLKTGKKTAQPFESLDAGEQYAWKMVAVAVEREIIEGPKS